jgi:hypothetical protein
VFALFAVSAALPIFVAAGPATALTASEWSIVASPVSLPAHAGVLMGVSCSEPTACTAVGEAIGTTSQSTLVERWDGTDWAVVASPDPTGSTETLLNGVSCTGADACIAVGRAFDGFAQVTLAERWNGTTWSILPTPNPTGAIYSELLGVSCRSATACTAVGATSNGPRKTSIVERWDGIEWTIVSSPNPSDSTMTELRGVACVSDTVCTAVGRTADSFGTVARLVEHWDGAGWSIVTSVNSPSVTFSVFHGVSCVSPSACIAVGTMVGTSGGDVPLVERWNGASWSTIPAPVPTNTMASDLFAVSCATATACTAVGRGAHATGYSTLVEQWEGTAWSIASSPNPTDYDRSDLVGIACPGLATCMAVGGSANSATAQPLALRERPALTSTVSVPTTALLCPPRCRAVGDPVVRTAPRSVATARPPSVAPTSVSSDSGMPTVTPPGDQQVAAPSRRVHDHRPGVPLRLGLTGVVGAVTVAILWRRAWSRSRALP